MKVILSGNVKNPDAKAQGKLIGSLIKGLFPDAEYAMVSVYDKKDFTLDINFGIHGGITAAVSKIGEHGTLWRVYDIKGVFNNVYEKENAAKLANLETALNGDAGIIRRGNPAPHKHFYIAVSDNLKKRGYYGGETVVKNAEYINIVPMAKAVIFRDEESAKAMVRALYRKTGADVMDGVFEVEAHSGEKPRAKNPAKKPERWYHKDADGHYVVSNEPYWGLAGSSSTEYGAKTLADLKRTYKGVTLKASWGESPDNPKT